MRDSQILTHIAKALEHYSEHHDDTFDNVTQNDGDSVLFYIDGVPYNLTIEVM